MPDLSTKTALVLDYGMFLPFAERLARDFGQLLYYTPWRSAYPHTVDAAAGDGVPGVERVDNFWDALEIADIVVFPDCYDADLQMNLRARGVRVWGSGGGSWLELQRTESRAALRAKGVAVPKSKEIVGVDALRRWAYRTEDRWVKRSTFRGDFETFHHQKAFITDNWLDVLQRDYGPLAAQITFVVEEPVPGVEVGWDAHCIDGQYPELGFYGVETKDKALVGVMKRFDALPNPVRDVYAKVAPFLKEGNYRNYLTLELRLDDAEGPATLLDPCCRLGSPASEAWMELVGNVSQVVWEGAEGKLIEAEPTAKYGVLAVIDSPWAVRNWTAIDCPKSMERWVKVKNRCVVGGKTYYIPGKYEMSEVGVLVALGDTLDEAVGLCQDRAKEVSGYKVSVMADSLRESMDVIQKGESVGLAF